MPLDIQGMLCGTGPSRMDNRAACWIRRGLPKNSDGAQKLPSQKGYVKPSTGTKLTQKIESIHELAPLRLRRIPENNDSIFSYPLAAFQRCLFFTRTGCSVAEGPEGLHRSVHKGYAASMETFIPSIGDGFFPS